MGMHSLSVLFFFEGINWTQILSKFICNIWLKKVKQWLCIVKRDFLFSCQMYFVRYPFQPVIFSVKLTDFILFGSTMDKRLNWIVLECICSTSEFNSNKYLRYKLVALCAGKYLQTMIESWLQLPDTIRECFANSKGGSTTMIGVPCLYLQVRRVQLYRDVLYVLARRIYHGKLLTAYIPWMLVFVLVHSRINRYYWRPWKRFMYLSVPI